MSEEISKESSSNPMFTVPLDLCGGPTELAEAFHNFVSNNRIQSVASADTFQWRGRLASRNGQMLWQVRSNYDWEFSSSSECADIIVVTIPERGGLAESSTDDILVPGQAQVLNVPADRRYRACADGEHARTAFKWTAAEVQRALTSNDEDIDLDSLGSSPVLDLTDDRGQVIVALLNAIAIDLTSSQISSPLASNLMNEAALRLLFDPLLRRWKESHGRGDADILPRHVKHATEYMRENAGKPIRIRDVADACCVTARTLENGFRSFKNTTPAAYLRQVRLDAVHNELKTALFPVRVSEIARRWGFTELGRFAESYRRAFGELPSKTVRR